MIAPLFFLSLPQSCYYVGEIGENVYKDRNLIAEGGFFILISFAAFIYWMSVQYYGGRFFPYTHAIVSVVLYTIIILISIIIFSLRWIAAGSIYLAGDCVQAGGIELDSSAALLFAISAWLPLLLLLGAVAGIVTVLAARKGA